MDALPVDQGQRMLFTSTTGIATHFTTNQGG